MKKMMTIMALLLGLVFAANGAPLATIVSRPLQIDLSSLTSESAVKVTLSGYAIDLTRYRLYSGANQYSVWDAPTSTFVGTSNYSSSPLVLGTPTTTTTFWIPFQKGNAAMTTSASYRDRQSPYSGNYQTVALPAATAIVTASTLTKSGITFTTWSDYTVKYVILGYDGSNNLITATSTALTTGDFSLKYESTTTLAKIEVRSLTDQLIETVNLGGGAPEMDLKQGITAILDGGSYDFGSKNLNTNTDAVFTIENSGTADLILTTPITIGGADAGQFSVTAQPSSSVAASGTTTYTVRFTPTSDGAKTATISIDNNDADENPYNLTITGTGVIPPSISLSATAGTTSGSYSTLKAAFDAINAGTHQGAITISVIGNTTETASAQLNYSGLGSASYTSVNISPDATARTITGSVAGALIDLYGADNVTIDGTAGKLLTISNTNTSGTVISIDRHDNDASNNTITNCAITGGAMIGITIGKAPGTTISQNKIFGLTGGGSVTGINMFSTNTGIVSIVNNMITLQPSVMTFGIKCVETINTLNLYYNSVYLNANGNNSYVFYKSNTSVTTAMNVKNNIFYNAQISGMSRAIVLDNITNLHEDNNLLYSAFGDFGSIGGSTANSISAWSTLIGGGNDANSQSGIVGFEALGSGNLSFTNIAANNIVFNKGTTETVGGITTDYFGQPRKAFSATDIGAYEFQSPSEIANGLIPATNSLSQNYPNPFNPATTIDFALAKEANINLTVYNTKGEVVKTLVNSNFNAGNHSVNFNANGLNSGVYIYKLSTPESSFTKKMILVK